VDNLNRQDYVLFEFSAPVVVDRTFLASVQDDSDITLWIGNANNPFNNHLNLNDSLLNNLGFTEVNNASNGSDRWADINANDVIGNVLVIAAKTNESTPNDEFKIKSLEVQQLLAPPLGSLVNTASVTAPIGFIDINANNNSATDSDPLVSW
jgi:hypothetical protein